MKKRTHRSDLNQREIVKALRQIGAIVFITGRPVDLIVSYRGRNFLIDCKKVGWTDKDLTPFQKDFREEWKGQLDFVATPEEAIRIVTAVGYDPDID